MIAQPTFYYDLASPECYLVAERSIGELGAVPAWEPVAAAALGTPVGEVDREAIAAGAERAGLLPVRWPASWPPDSTAALLAATFAKGIGKVVAFSLAAFRQAFAAGADLGQTSTVLLAGAACEIHPAALLKAIELRSARDSLRRAGEEARAAGVTRLPAICVDGRVFEGRRALERAAGAVAAGAR